MKRTNQSMTVAEYLRRIIEASGKTQTRIAEECGFDKSNIMTMLKKGQTKVPIGKVGVLARSLGLDAMELWSRVMREYHPDTWAELERSVSNQPLLTRSEIELIELVRAGHIDPSALVAHASVGGPSAGRAGAMTGSGIAEGCH